MKSRTLSVSLILISLLISGLTSSLLAQSNPMFIPLSGGAKAALYRPDGIPSPRVGVLTVHRTSNKMDSRECRELSKRGFAVLCLNTRFENNEALIEWEKIALDVKQGVEYLKNQQRVSKVMLYGHSGGGATMG